MIGTYKNLLTWFRLISKSCVVSCLSSGHSQKVITITTDSRCHPELLLVRSPWELGLTSVLAVLSVLPGLALPEFLRDRSGRRGWLFGKVCWERQCLGCLFWMQSVQPLLQPWPCTWPPARSTAALGLSELQAAADISHALVRHFHSPL